MTTRAPTEPRSEGHGQLFLLIDATGAHLRDVRAFADVGYAVEDGVGGPFETAFSVPSPRGDGGLLTGYVRAEAPDAHDAIVVAVRTPDSRLVRTRGPLAVVAYDATDATRGLDATERAWLVAIGHAPFFELDLTRPRVAGVSEVGAEHDPPPTDRDRGAP